MRTLPRYATHVIALLAAGILLQPAQAATRTRWSPRVTVSPTALSFGSVTVGETKTLSAVLSNAGGYSVRIYGAGVSNSSFSLGTLAFPITLRPGQSLRFNVGFAPGAATTATGSVKFTTWRSLNVASLPLSGTGTSAAGSLTANPSTMSFAGVQVGSTATQVATLTNSGTSSVVVNQVSTAAAGFQVSGLALPATLAAGQTASFKVTFAPQSAGTFTGAVSITNSSATPTMQIALSGTATTPGGLTPSPASISFGAVPVGTAKSTSEVLTNSGGSSVTVSSASASGAGFTISGINLPLTLSPKQSYTFQVSFQPQSSVAANGSVALVSNASNANLSIPLSGSGAASGQLSVSPTSLTFGSVVVGSSQKLSATLSAGGSSVTLSSASSSSPEFTVSGVSLPTTISAGQSLPLTVTFAPQASGATTANLAFASNAANSPTVESVTGSGTTAVQHSVSLSWNPSTSSVVGYNIYRGGTSGGPYSQLNSSLNATANYTDSSVQSGKTYYYVTTAVDGSGAESGYSNQAQAIIP